MCTYESDRARTIYRVLIAAREGNARVIAARVLLQSDVGACVAHEAGGVGRSARFRGCLQRQLVFAREKQRQEQSEEACTKTAHAVPIIWPNCTS